MNQKEFQAFVAENKRKVDQAKAEFDKHSKEFDKKAREILASL